MRVLFLTALLSVVACGPTRGPVRAEPDSLEQQDLPSKQQEEMVSPALIPAEAIIYQDNAARDGWKLISTKPGFPDQDKVIMVFRRPRKP